MLEQYCILIKGEFMWKAAGLKVLGSLVDSMMNAGGTHYRRSGIASALDSTADMLFLNEQAKRAERIMQEWIKKQQITHEQKSERKDNYEQPHKVENTDVPYQFYRKLLGLNEPFTQNELKAAYRICAVKYHPDQYVNADSRERQHAEDIMKQINEAYEYLKDC
jgi:DnaJ-domain-containing protein 1